MDVLFWLMISLLTNLILFYLAVTFLAALVLVAVKLNMEDSDDIVRKNRW